MEGRRADAGVSGVEAYRHGLRIIREAIGPDAYLLGCGAPILPSVGLVDAMRVGPDIGHHFEPLDGDLSQPSQRAAAQNSRWRAWQHGRFWVNDADCLVAGTARRAPGGLGRRRRAVQRPAGQQRPAARARRLGAGDHPPAAPPRADRPVRALTSPVRIGDGRALRLQPPCGRGRGPAQPALGSRPLEDWEDDRLIEIPQRGISRHVVRFIAEAGEVFALKEIPERFARREYSILRRLQQMGIPAVDVLGVVIDRPQDLDAMLVTDSSTTPPPSAPSSPIPGART